MYLTSHAIGQLTARYLHDRRRGRSPEEVQYLNWHLLLGWGKGITVRVYVCVCVCEEFGTKFRPVSAYKIYRKTNGKRNRICFLEQFRSVAGRNLK
jgi:hypothetical protein